MESKSELSCGDLVIDDMGRYGIALRTNDGWVTVVMATVGYKATYPTHSLTAVEIRGIHVNFASIIPWVVVG